MKIDKSKIDVTATFLVFTACVGDIERTSLETGLSPDVVRALAEEEKWIERLKKCSLMSKSEVPGMYERAVNRGIMFIQGHALRSVVQRILDVLSKQEGNELLATLSQTKAGQITYNAKFLAELSQAAERANYLCLTALGDTVPEREVEKAGEESLNMTELHLAVSMALSHPIAAGAERRILEQNVVDIVKANIPPKPPTGE